jgi:DNA-3-methyladenine glycosylase II
MAALIGNSHNSIMEHIHHLSKDKKLKKILPENPLVLEPRKKVYLRLVSSITSQQLSTKVAKVIYQRFLDLFGGKEPSPQQILDTAAEILCSIGLSRAKASYVHNVCSFFIENKLTDARLQKMENEEIIELLTQIKGVGRWTVEMILMFTLGRQDVFALDDLGIQQGIAKLYKLDTTDKKQLKEKMLSISNKWAPYRTYACRYIWNWKDS